jgi:hypothetical protein
MYKEYRMAATPVPVTIDAKQYYNSKDLCKYNPEFYYGCTVKPRNIVQKKKIPPTDYIYANPKANEWNLSTEECKKAQLLIAKSWVDTHYFKQETPTGVVESEIKTLAPLYLSDEEKFKDENGTILEIKTCGDKTTEGIYFKVQDVMNSFDIPGLDHTLHRDITSYERGIHYDAFFIRATLDNIQSHTIKKELYLTYRGLLRVLNVTRNKRVQHFQSWADKTLFTIQMGKKEDKIQLGTSILNIKIEAYKAVFETFADKLSVIYLFSLGTVGALRDTFGIDPSINDQSIVHKLGCTDDLKRRHNELCSEYNKLPNVTMELKVFRMVEVQYKYQAEQEIKNFCKAFDKKLITEGKNELIILNKEEYEIVKTYYRRVGNEFAGSSAELQNKITEMEQKIVKIEHEKETLKHQIELERAISERKLLEKDFERSQIEMKVTEKDHLLERERDRAEMLRSQMASDKMIFTLQLQLANSRSTKACPEDTLVTC